MQISKKERKKTECCFRNINPFNTSYLVQTNTHTIVAKVVIGLLNRSPKPSAIHNFCKSAEIHLLVFTDSVLLVLLLLTALIKARNVVFKISLEKLLINIVLW